MVKCPHCGSDTDIAEESFANGMFQYLIRHCSHCNCRYRLNHRYEITEMLERGITPTEQKDEINRFAAAHYEASMSRYHRF